jgi:NAD(P)-dependent dehydrogenase (short-subunit alcohol dehydrogenase family)
VTDSEAVDAAAVEIREKLGAPSILINNAGIGHDFPVFDIPPHRVKKLIEVNLTSHWYVHLHSLIFR